MAMRAVLPRLTVVAVLLVPACGTTTLKPGALKSRAGQTIGVVNGKPASFETARGSDGIGTGIMYSFTGLVGVAVLSLARAQTDEKLFNAHPIVDPAPGVAEQVLQMLASGNSLVVKTPKPLRKRDRFITWDTRLVLEVKTEAWGISAFRADWSRYHVGYALSVELRDERADKVLATGECHVPSPEDPTGAPTYDELLANEAILLKNKINDGATYCARRLTRILFHSRLPGDTTAPNPLEGTPCDKETSGWEHADATRRREIANDCLSWKREHPIPAAPATAATTPATPGSTLTPPSGSEPAPTAPVSPPAPPPPASDPALPRGP
jgi:hypothetical protein